MRRYNQQGFQVVKEPYFALFHPVAALTPDTYDRNGILSIEMLLIFTRQTRNMMMSHPYDDSGTLFLDMDHLFNTTMFFTSSHRMMISKKVYNGDIMLKIKSTLFSKFSIAHIGTASYSTCLKIFADGIEDPLIEEITQLVTVDKVNHRPMPLPQWHRDKYKGRTMMRSPFRVKPKPIPRDTVTRKVTVQWTDTDFYNHCAFSTYSRYATDSIRSFFLHENHKTDKTHVSSSTGNPSVRSILPGLTEEFVNNGVKQLDIGFLKECVQGDILETHLWQEEGQPGNKVMCSICRDNQEVCQMTLEFYED